MIITAALAAALQLPGLGTYLIRQIFRDATSARAATLKITFAAEATDDVEAFAAAERICCRTLGFDVQRDPVALTITASPMQLDAMQQLFASG